MKTRMTELEKIESDNRLYFLFFVYIPKQEKQSPETDIERDRRCHS